MEFLTSKVFMVAFGIFATLMITTAVLVLLGYVLDIYSNVAKIDYSTVMPTDEFTRYNLTVYDGSKFTSEDTFSGIEIYNMINKYKNKDNVYINGGALSSYKKELLESISSDKALRARYYCAVITNTDEKVEIVYKLSEI